MGRGEVAVHALTLQCLSVGWLGAGVLTSGFEGDGWDPSEHVYDDCNFRLRSRVPGSALEPQPDLPMPLLKQSSTRPMLLPIFAAARSLCSWLSVLA